MTRFRKQGPAPPSFSSSFPPSVSSLSELQFILRLILPRCLYLPVGDDGTCGIGHTCEIAPAAALVGEAAPVCHDIGATHPSHPCQVGAMPARLGLCCMFASAPALSFNMACEYSHRNHDAAPLPFSSQHMHTHNKSTRTHVVRHVCSLILSADDLLPVCNDAAHDLLPAALDLMCDCLGVPPLRRPGVCGRACQRRERQP